MPLKYAFVGLGNLGAHLARSLLKAGFALTIHDLDRASAEALIDDGAAWALRANMAMSSESRWSWSKPCPEPSNGRAKVMVARPGRQWW